MQEDTQQNRPGAPEVRRLFDQTLGHHIERLIGTKYGIGALPVNLVTISCLILLTERECGIEGSPSTSGERYTHETLANKLAEVGVDIDEDLNTLIKDMIERGYIDVDDGGRFTAKKPTISMAQLLDHAFPKMPGMNLIAYFVQTMDEVHSGRKDLYSAIRQFEQILQIQGVSLLIKETQPGPKKAPSPSVKREIKQRKIEKPFTPRSERRILSADGDLGEIRKREVEITELSGWRAESPEISPEMDEALEISREMDEAVEGQELDLPQEAEVGEPDEKAETEVPSEGLSDLSSEPSSELEEAKSLQPEDALQPAETKIEAEVTSEGHAVEKADDMIEERIVTFEEDLARQCPICKIAVVKPEETATGKVYYKCSNKDCNLISWGRPYHLVCPQCKNPFLVENPDRDGKTILKCPRATCHYWQRLPGDIADAPQEKAISQDQEPVKSKVVSRKPRRKVLRRKVVRRKR